MGAPKLLGLSTTVVQGNIGYLKPESLGNWCYPSSYIPFALGGGIANSNSNLERWGRNLPAIMSWPVLVHFCSLPSVHTSHSALVHGCATCCRHGPGNVANLVKSGFQGLLPPFFTQASIHRSLCGGGILHGNGLQHVNGH